MKVSIGIIAYNEELFIEKLFQGLIKQIYPHDKIEIVLVDGKSSDGTWECMKKFQESNDSFANIVVLENPKRFQAAGWNVVLQHYTGDVLIRLDAHAEIPEDFVSKNVACIESGESVCGGHRINIAQSDKKGQKLLLMAENSMFGSGIAAYRRKSGRQYVKTVAHACYRREVLEKVGFFDERLMRSEDNDFHARIRQARYRICMDGEIVSYYQTRATLKGILKQKWGNGKWIGLTSLLKSPKIFSSYHFVPLAFVIAAMLCVLLFGLSFLSSTVWWLRIPFYVGIGVYLIADLILTFKSSFDNREPLGLLALPFLFPMLHFAYGLGTLVGVLAAPFQKKKFESDAGSRPNIRIA